MFVQAGGNTSSSSTGGQNTVLVAYNNTFVKRAWPAPSASTDITGARATSSSSSGTWTVSVFPLSNSIFTGSVVVEVDKCYNPEISDDNTEQFTMCKPTVSPTSPPVTSSSSRTSTSTDNLSDEGKIAVSVTLTFVGTLAMASIFWFYYLRTSSVKSAAGTTSTNPMINQL
jgi:hypothetical protein